MKLPVTADRFLTKNTFEISKIFTLLVDNVNLFAYLSIMLNAQTNNKMSTLQANGFHLAFETDKSEKITIERKVTINSMLNGAKILWNKERSLMIHSDNATSADINEIIKTVSKFFNNVKHIETHIRWERKQ